MKNLAFYALLFFGWQHVFAQNVDSSRIEFFFRAGADQTKKIVNNPPPEGTLSQAYQNGIKKSDFIQGHCGLVFQKANGWGFGLLYSFFNLPEISFLRNEYFGTLYPNYELGNFYNLPSANPITMGNNYQHFLSIHLEHSFQKKFWFARPFAEIGTGFIKISDLNQVLKKRDENKFLEARVNFNSRPSFNATFGLDLGVRFLKDFFSISFSPGLAHYSWNWTQTETAIDLKGNQIKKSANYATSQTRFIFMVNLGCRIPLNLRFPIF